jgi:dipeptidyl aminopeptidase/acylaminoacyl peptidase
VLTAAPPPPTGSVVFDRMSLDGQREQLYRERADGTGVVRVTHTGRIWFEPRWLPDGDIASFWDTGLAVVTPDGRILKRIRIRRSTTRLEISPDGLRFAYVQEGCSGGRDTDPGCGTLWVGRLAGRGQRRLSPPRAVDISDRFGPVYTWSPDARRIAYVGFYGLVVVDVDTGRRHLIGPTRSFTASPDWSPDGGRILYVRGASLVTIDPDGSRRRRVRGAGHAFFAQWSPDGRRIAWLRDDATRSAWVVSTVAGGDHLDWER